MLRVREVSGETADELCRKHGVEKDEYDRVFELDGEAEGVGLTRLTDGKIRIGKVVTNGDALSGEMLFRTLLLDATRVKNVEVVVSGDRDCSEYGFRKNGGVWTAITDDIVFPHKCGGEELQECSLKL